MRPSHRRRSRPSAPSRAMSVWMIAATPQSSKRRASSTTPISVVSAQPSTATRPSRASMPTAIAPGMIGRGTPHQLGVAQRRGAEHDAVDAERRASARSRRGRGCRRRAGCAMPTASRIAATASPLTERPAKAPSRSTTCSHAKPASANCAGLRRRVVVEDGGARHLAADEANAGAVLQIDRRIEDHGARRLLVEELVVVMAGDDPALDPRVDRMGAPAPIAEALVEADRRAAGCRADRG